jgi:CheY-like chemotaxis protein
VEDDIVDRKQMERLPASPSASDYDPAFADCLDRALALLAEREFDIVLLDLNRPRPTIGAVLGGAVPAHRARAVGS